MPAASTDPVRAWRSGNRWFLAQCGFGTGKLGNCRAGQCAQVENSGHIGCRWGQCNGMAGLTDSAGIAVGIGCVRFCTRSMAWAVGRSLGRIGHHCFGILMSLYPRFMGVCCCHFWSSLLLLLHLGGKHSRRHRIAHPAAQRQQGDHEDEEQVAHGVVGDEGLLKVQFMTQRSLPLKTASHGEVA
ncbi:hypothetical protein BH10PSE16_BH10PSE16_04600 [soil metagenome]